MFSIYTSAFNVIKNGFDYGGALTNFADFATEIVIAVNASEDGSLEAIREYTANLSHERQGDKPFFVKVISTDIPYSDPNLDGALKNVALQETTRQYKISLDLDERIPLSRKPAWITSAKLLELYPRVQSIMIPSVDLYKGPKYCKGIGSKWYLHRAGLFRGVVNFARNSDGTHDITKSDGCELIDSSGDLVEAIDSVPFTNNSVPEKLSILRKINHPYVLHYGYVDLERRAKLNADFWKDHWALESGRPVDIPTTVEALDNFPIYEHNLPLC